MKITQKHLQYLNKEFDVDDWNQVEHELKAILTFVMTSTDDLELVIHWSNELLDEVEYKDTQNYVILSTNMSNKEIASNGEEYKKNILFKAKPYFHEIEMKIYNSEFIKSLNCSFDHYRNILKKNIRLYNETNLELKEKEDALCLKYRKEVSNVVVDYNGEQLTRAQAYNLLNTASQEDKPVIWSFINNAWLSKKSELDIIFNQILEIRHQIALNCDFENYGEYLHLSHSRLEYSLDDIKSLHDSIEEVLIPELKKMVAAGKPELDNTLKYPWEDAFKAAKTSHKPFETSDELVDKINNILQKIDPEFSTIFSNIRENGNMDLEPRKKKTTGGFCFPIDRTGSPFICMNVAGRPEETNILIHEAGHGIHSVLNSHQKVRGCRMFSSNGELAEFPPKFFELLAFDYYDEFYDNMSDTTLAQKEHYITLLYALRKYVIIDAFEQWIYTNPGHSISERDESYSSLVDKFNVNDNWEGYESFKSLEWYKSQLVVIMPFYIVSYAIAQLGAINLYKNYRQNKDKTITQLKEMLRMGFSRPISELYNTVGLEFNFSRNTLKDTVDFISQEITNLNLNK
ncbi:MAG: hypothetical protein JEZ08_02080 [Clostridiales bacterium]|nr:hypothetical protein [Clostridiales bacterium]